MTHKPGARVLAYHGPLLYEAKVLKVHEKGKSFVVDPQGGHEPVGDHAIPPHLADDTTFFLHYKGWNSKWDEWVTSERVLEINDAGLALKKKLRDEWRQKNLKAPSTGPASMAGTRGVKRRADTPEARAKKRRQDVVLAMSNRIKCMLVDDWEHVTKHRMLVKRPVRSSVRQILCDYCETVSQFKAPMEQNVCREVVEGLQVYFDKGIRKFLLYRYERLEYGEILKAEGPGVDLCEHYGFEHLIRLFASLPGLISQTTMDGPSVGVLLSHSKEILDFLEENHHEYVNDYIYAAPWYDSLARA